MVHFNWTQLHPLVNHDNVHVATALVTGGVLIAFAAVGRMALGTGEAAIIPSSKFSIKGLFEVILEFIANLLIMVIGDKGTKFAPMLASIFFFILFSNIVGLIPGMTPSTDNINTTLALGLFTFGVYNWYGVKEHGVKYINQFLGPLLFLAPFMFFLELISHAIRPFSLALRLWGNMMGDHTVLSIFLDLVPYGVPVIFYALGLFVCFMQAFVFSLLTMIYLSMAISHDH